MKLEDHIEKLFEGEELPEDLDSKKSLPIIAPNALDDDRVFQRLREIEKRQFTRIDVSEKKLELKFVNGAQFARQYIENISIGGLFVRTDEKHSMGETLPIEFSIPVAIGQMKTFRLSGKVCRVSAQGVGLEFTNLPSETRTELETYVRSVLPKNSSLTSKTKASTIENLERLRALRMESAARRKKFMQHVVVMLILLSINGYLIRETVEDQIAVSAAKEQLIHIGEKTIKIADIQSIEKSKNDEWLLRLSDQTTVRMNPDAINNQLPEYLQHSIRLLKAAPVKKEVRRSMNTNGLSNLHR